MAGNVNDGQYQRGYCTPDSTAAAFSRRRRRFGARTASASGNDG